MIARITQRPLARLDLLEQFVYFGERENVELAERYLNAVAATCLQLASHPRSAALYESRIAELTGLRRMPVKGFENYLLFYLPLRNGIDVIRILHGAQDIDSLFAQEP